MYSGSEQIYQSDKADCIGHSTVAADICNTSDPVQQKSISNKLPLGNTDWPHKHSMEQAVRAKFNQNPACMEYLKSTAPKLLVEANPHDQEWANGLSINDPDCLNPVKFKGKNELGKLLMNIRDN